MIKYPFKVFQTEMDGHIFWIAKSNYLKGCVGQGDLQEEAIKELEENEAAWLETAEEAAFLSVYCLMYICKQPIWHRWKESV